VIARAAEEVRGVEEVAARYKRAWWEAMDVLGVKRPSDVPHATAHVGRMVEVVAEPVRRGLAYETADGVHLSVEKIDGYGLLAHQPLAWD